MPRLLPRPVFQALVLALLPAAACLAAYEWLAGRGLYRWLRLLLGGGQSSELAALGLAVIGYLSLVMLVALFLRAFTADLPTLRQQLDDPSSLEGRVTPATRERALAAASVTIGVACATVAGASWAATDGLIARWQLALGLAGLGLVGWGLLRLARTLVRR
jgi:hypothetical protein